MIASRISPGVRKIESRMNFFDRLLPKFFRCTRFRFGPLLAPQILPRLKYVAEQENVNLTDDGEKALMALSGGDMRKVRKSTSSYLLVLRAPWSAVL